MFDEVCVIGQYNIIYSTIEVKIRECSSITSVWDGSDQVVGVCGRCRVGGGGVETKFSPLLNYKLL